MANDDDIDWDAFAILSADPEIDVATAYAASIRDEPPQQQQPTSGQALLVITAIIVAVVVFIFLMAM